MTEPEHPPLDLVTTPRPTTPGHDGLTAPALPGDDALLEHLAARATEPDPPGVHDG